MWRQYLLDIIFLKSVIIFLRNWPQYSSFCLSEFSVPFLYFIESFLYQHLLYLVECFKTCPVPLVEFSDVFFCPQYHDWMDAGHVWVCYLGSLADC